MNNTREDNQTNQIRKTLPPPTLPPARPHALTPFHPPNLPSFRPPFANPPSRLPLHPPPSGASAPENQPRPRSRDPALLHEPLPAGGAAGDPRLLRFGEMSSAVDRRKSLAGLSGEGGGSPLGPCLGFGLFLGLSVSKTASYFFFSLS